MVFYTGTKRRKYIFRTSILFAILIFFLWSLHTALGITGAVPQYVADPELESYGYYYSRQGGKQVALTFDDGPDPVYTPQVLEILKRYDVPATFFFLGENILHNQEIVKEVSESGFEIGNHTFTHSEHVHDSKRRLSWELNATNRLLESITGHSVTLYRPPFLLDIGTHPAPDPEEKDNGALAWALEDGYIPVGANADSKDFEAQSAEEIIDRVLSSVTAEERIILLHDR